jgi:hypothetical protein
VGLQIITFEAEVTHFPFVVDLARSYYPPGHPVLSHDFLHWLLLDNPAGPARLVVAREDHAWVGMIMLIPLVLRHGANAQKACFAVNVLTHPEHRNKNLFVRMIVVCKEFLGQRNIWLLGHPNANALPGWKRQGMQFRDALHPYLAKIRLPFSLLRQKRMTSLSELQALPADFWRQLITRTDCHVSYTPEYIAWRFIAAPHRDYAVSAIERRGDFMGLRITRRYKGPLDLMIDFVGTSVTLANVISSVVRPTLVMHSGKGYSGSAVNSACLRLPIKRTSSFFVSTWLPDEPETDMSGISLTASDF